MLCLLNVFELSLLRSMKGNQNVLNISVADTVGSDLLSCFEKICSFTGTWCPCFI